MSFNKFTPLTKINGSKIKWKIRVRAQAVWKGITRETKEFRGLNMILVDDSKFRIHAFVNARYAHMFEKDIEEGQIYNIENFIVQDYTGVEFHRCVRYEKHIYFAEYTKIEKSSNEGLQIPLFSFDIFNLVDLDKMESNKRFLCDVAGIVTGNSELRDYVNDNEEGKKQKRFSICDGSCIVKVTFFDEFAEYVDQALKHAVSHPVTIIIGSAKLGRFQGELTLTNYPATRVFLNCDHSCVKDLKTRAKDPSFFKEVVSHMEDIVEKLQIAEIKALTELDIQKKVMCDIVVKKVEENLHWYDCICPKCNILLAQENERFKCSKCGKYYPWPPKRFRVCLYACDSTGGLPIILGDREVRKLTGKTVFDITLDQAEEDEDKFPDVIKEFRDKKFRIILKITEENIKNDLDVYEVCDICLPGDENVADRENTTIQSPSAEDDNTAIMDFMHTQSVVQASPIEASPVETNHFVGSKKTRKVRKISNIEDELPDNISLSNFQSLKSKNDKLCTSTTKKKKSPTEQKVSEKIINMKTAESENTNEDEDISLNNFQKKMQHKGKQTKL